MIPRYITEDMGKVWEDEAKFFGWLRIELAILKARKEIGEIDVEIPEDLFKRISIDPAEIYRIEQEVTKHDVVAFLNHVSPQLPEQLRPFFHEGVTSYDIGDTTLSLQLIGSLEIIKRNLQKLMEVIKALAYEYKNTPQMGRTHGIHAELITFGVKLANWYSELERRMDSLEYVSREIAVGKISGAVGMYTLDPQVEEGVCEYLDLSPVIATQIISRDIISDYMCCLGNLGATLSKIALNIRLLSQTDVGEVKEPFGKKQKGSSAMPHKQNPILSERVCGIMRVVQGNVNAAFTTQSDCWYERSLDNSSCERIIIPDSSMGVDYAIGLLIKIFSGLQVYPEKMMQKVYASHGLIFSQEVMMLLAEKGIPREEAHTIVRDIAMECIEEEKDFLSNLISDVQVMSIVTREELKECFVIENKIKYTDDIFRRVFKE